MILICVIACAKPLPHIFILADFESESELDRFHWECHTLFSLSHEHATHGQYALHLSLFPSEYPGMNPLVALKDWSPYRTLCLDLYNPQSTPLEMTIRIDDRHDNPDYPDRYNHSFLLSPGENHLSIPLEKLSTSDKNRNLNLATIHALVFFLAHPKERCDLFVDYIRLEK